MKCGNHKTCEVGTPVTRDRKEKRTLNKERVKVTNVEKWMSVEHEVEFLTVT